MAMHTTEPTPETDLFTEPPAVSNRNILLMIAALAILAGFFLPWMAQNRSNLLYDDEFPMPTVNGIYLVNLTSQIPHVGFLLMLFLVLVPIGSIIVAYNSYQHEFSEKIMMFGLAAAVFIPMSILSLYLMSPGARFLTGGFGGGLKLGIGMILMGAGAIYCLVYAIGRIGRNMQGIASGPLFKYGAVGGVLTALLVYIVMKTMSGEGAVGFYVYLLALIGGILSSVSMYRSKAVYSNYHSGQVAGFIFSGTLTVTLIILSTIESSVIIGRISEGLFFLLVFQVLFGFVVSSLVGNTETPAVELELEETTAVNRPNDSNPERME